MKFTITCVYEKQDFETLANIIPFRHRISLITPNKFKALLAAAAVVIWLIVALLTVRTLDLKIRYSIIPLAISCVVGIIFIFVRKTSTLGKASWKAYQFKGETVTYDFFDSYMTSSNSIYSSEIPYGNIVRVCENEHGFYLFISLGGAVILPKRDFEQNEIPLFREFILGTTKLQLDCV